VNDDVATDVEEYLQMARRARDPRRLLEGEDPDTSERSVAAYWIGVYSELLALERRSLNAIQQLIERSSPTARGEAMRTNVPLLSGQIERCRERLAYWQDRGRALEGQS
jgi:hypothetical protein